jgi:hypothetical protein
MNKAINTYNIAVIIPIFGRAIITIRSIEVTIVKLI